MPKLTIKQAADLIGVSTDTLRRWEDEGKIQSERTSGGHRRYDAAKLLQSEDQTSKTVCYARVSTRPQKADLDRQITVLSAYCEQQGWNYEVISDWGSGIKYNKKGLSKLVRLIATGQVQRLVLTHKDRLLRFGSELVFALCEQYGVEVLLLNKDDGATPEQELVQDVLEIITVFSARLYGLSSHQNKMLIDELEKSAKRIGENFGKYDESSV